MSLDLAILEEEWIEQAICAQIDPEMFFPEKGGSTREAKRMCGLCPVRLECLAYALDHDERFGIWGGLSERDRRKVKRSDLLTLIDSNTQENLMNDLPKYAVDIAHLLADTEGSPDPLVRAVRKIVTQSAIALQQAHVAFQTSGSDEPRFAQPLSDDETPPPSEPDHPAKRTRASSPAVELMRSRGIQASDVRAWCAQTGVPVSERGGISLDVVQAYVNHIDSIQEQAS